MRRFHHFILADDETEGVRLLFWRRLPWLLVGLLGGLAMTWVVARYEAILTGEIRLAFFLPVIVYLSDAVGAQTEIIVVRGLAKHRPHLVSYLLKESSLGLLLGSVFGALLWLFAYLWYHDAALALTVGLAMFIDVAVATVLGVIVPLVIYKENRDPALGAAPLTTIIQDFISILVYFTVASAILLL